MLLSFQYALQGSTDDTLAERAVRIDEGERLRRSHSLLVHSWRSETADFKFVSPVPCALCQKHLKHFLHIQLLQGTALRERFAYPVFGQEYKEAEDKSGM